MKLRFAFFTPTELDLFQLLKRKAQGRKAPVGTSVHINKEIRLRFEDEIPSFTEHGLIEPRDDYEHLFRLKVDLTQVDVIELDERPKLEVARSQFDVIQDVLNGQVIFESNGYAAPLTEFLKNHFPELAAYTTAKLLGPNRDNRSRAKNRKDIPSKRKFEIVRSNFREVSICLRGFTAWEFVPVDREIKPRGTPRRSLVTSPSPESNPKPEDVEPAEIGERAVSLEVRRLLSEVIVDRQRLQNLTSDELQMLRDAGISTLQEVQKAIEKIIEEMQERHLEDQIARQEELLAGLEAQMAELRDKLAELESQREFLIGSRLAA